MNPRGSVAVEGAGALLLSVLVLGLLFQISRASVAHLWFDHSLYEGLICVAQKQSTRHCENLVRRKAALLPLGASAIRIHIWKNGKNWQGDIQWEGSLGLTGRSQLRLALAQIAKADSRWSRCCF